MSPPPMQRVQVFGATDVASSVASLKARQGTDADAQRHLFASECRAAGTIRSRVKTLRRVRAPQAVVVASVNTYYNRCRDSAGNDAIRPDVTRAALDELFQTVDIAVLNEVVFDAVVRDAELQAAKDSYPFKFFALDDFNPCIKMWQELRTQKGYTIVDGDCYMSSMYRQRFGNVVMVNNKTLEVVEAPYVQRALLEIIPQTDKNQPSDPEGRSAVFVHVRHRVTGNEFVFCGTHLTEKQVGQGGERQRAMMQALLKTASERYPNLPMVLTGDFNINQFAELPAAVQDEMRDNRFLNAPCTPYDLLHDAGFCSTQHYATQQHNAVLRTVWNGGCVDYVGAKGLAPTCIGTIPPVHDGYVISDHAFPFAVYDLSRPNGCAYTCCNANNSPCANTCAVAKSFQQQQQQQSQHDHQTCHKQPQQLAACSLATTTAASSTRVQSSWV